MKKKYPAATMAALDLQNLSSGLGSMQVTENDLMCHSIDMFKKPKKELALSHGRTICVPPNNGTMSSGPYIFQIPATGTNFIQSSLTKMYGKCKITKPDGSDIETGKNFSIVNMFPVSLFETIDIEVNGSAISELSSTLHHYKTFIESTLCYGMDAAQSHLLSGLYHPDRSFEFDSTTKTPAAAEKTATTPAVLYTPTTGYQKRAEIVKESKVFDFCIPLQHSFLMVDTFLPPNVPFTIKLTRSSDAFSIIDGDATKGNYKVEILELKLYVRLVELHPQAQSGLMGALQKEPAHYQMNKTVLKNFSVASGSQGFQQGQIFTGIIPKTIIVTAVLTESFYGSYGSNPWVFQPFDCNYAALRVGGELVPSDPYAPNFTKDLFAREYSDLFSNIGVHHSNTGNYITMDTFKKGRFFFAWDLSPDGCNGFHLHPPVQGGVDLELKFGTVLPKPITVLVYAVYDNTILLHDDKTVTTAVLV
jgi:hypothetical protein